MNKVSDALFQAAKIHYSSTKECMNSFIEEIHKYCDEDLKERITDWDFDGDKNFTILVDIDDYSWKCILPEDLLYFIETKSPNKITYEDIKWNLYE